MAPARSLARNSRPSLCADEGAVQEVVGFILMFALSSVILLISVQSFMGAKESSEEVLAGVELKAIATRVSSRLVDAGIVAQDFPDATFTVTLSVPRQVAGYEYEVEARPSEVVVTSLEGGLSARATTFRLEALAGLTVSGSAYSSRGEIEIAYEKTGAAQTITLKEVI